MSTFYLNRLDIQNIRNLRAVSFQPHEQLTILWGENGSGKTSVLEALHLLSLGRSFRAGRARRVVHDEVQEAVVFAAFSNSNQAGIKRGSNGSTQLRLNQMSQISQADMAKQLPLVLFDPESMSILDEGSKPRRALLDWGVFHVEHRFYPLWLRYQRALKQRNSLLKSGNIGRSQSGVWQRELAESAKLLHEYRQDYIEQWQPLWRQTIQYFLPNYDLVLDYQAGWDVEQDLQQILAESWEKDCDRGFTQIGPHRADLRVKLGTAPADEILSRGQKKLLVCALKLSQVLLLQQQGLFCVLLVDDIASELDSEARKRFLQQLLSSSAQVFITCIEPDSVLPALQQTKQPFSMFHVEHGTLIQTV